MRYRWCYLRCRQLTPYAHATLASEPIAYFSAKQTIIDNESKVLGFNGININKILFLRLNYYDLMLIALCLGVLGIIRSVEQEFINCLLALITL